MKATDISAIASTVAPVALRHGVERVYLFGSRARGDNRPDSDYDFLISKGEVDSLLRHASLLYDLEDALQGPVDLVTDTSEDKAFIANVRKDAVLLYERAR